MDRKKKLELLREFGWSAEQVKAFLETPVCQVASWSSDPMSASVTIGQYINKFSSVAEVDLYISDVVLAAAVRYVQTAHKLTTLGIPSEVTIADLINEKEEGSWKDEENERFFSAVGETEDAKFPVDPKYGLGHWVVSAESYNELHAAFTNIVRAISQQRGNVKLREKYPHVDPKKFDVSLTDVIGLQYHGTPATVGEWLTEFDKRCAETKLPEAAPFLEAHAETYCKVCDFLGLEFATTEHYNLLLVYCRSFTHTRKLQERLNATAETYVRVLVGKNVTTLSEEQYVFLATRYPGVESKKFHTLLKEVTGCELVLEIGKVPTVGDFLLWYHEQQESSCRSFSPTVLEYGVKVMQYLYPPVEVMIDVENTNISRTTKFTKRALEIGREYEPKIKLLLSKDFSVYALHDGKLTYLGIAEPDVECIDNPFYHTPELGILREPKL
jgi:hypothetical protein